MDRETAVKMWREIGLGMPGGGATGRLIEAFAVAVEAAERERFAALCRQAMPNPVTNWSDAQIVESLRAVLEHVVGPNVESNRTLPQQEVK